MSRVMRQLRRDHVNMTRLLGLLDMQLLVFDDGGAPDYHLMLDIMDYTMNYPDQCHHPKEDLVFRKLMERDANLRPLLEELLEEHVTLAEMTRAFAEALGKVVLDAELRRERVAKLARDYITATRLHMEREETIVFPRALDILGDEDWDEIDAEITADDPLFGTEVEARYLALHQSIISAPPPPIE